MSVIHLLTKIQAPVETVFDLSRSVDLHMISTKHTNETVVAGRTSGLFTVGDIITWRAKHLGFHQRLSVEIVRCDFPTYFEDRMIKGAFKSFTHKHYFETRQTETLMKDVFEFESPMGAIGKVFNLLLIKGYMTNLLLKRNDVIKTYAESANGQSLLKKVGYANSLPPID